MKMSKLALRLLTLLLCGVNTMSLAQSKLNVRGTISGEFRSRVTRQPNLGQDNDVRLNLFFHAGKQWMVPGQRRLSLTYDLRHYRYGEFSDFTRYDQTVNGHFGQNLGKKLKFLIADELRFRLHPSSGTFNYRRNVFDFNLKRKVGDNSNFEVGYQNWSKTYTDNASLSRYVSHRPYIKLGREFGSGLNLAAKIEYQNHKGNLYAGSTAPNQNLNLSGNRLVLRLNLDSVVSRRFISNLNYKFEFDYADEFGIEQSGENFDDENTEEFLAEDSDFGYTKHQGSLSVLLKADRKISFLFFYLFYTKGFDYWRVAVDGPKRRDKVAFLSHKLRMKLSKTLGLYIRYNFETNRTNLKSYKYTINSIAAGLSFTP